MLCVFGNDDGGGRLALRVDDRGVVYLPSSGAVDDGVDEEFSGASVREISNDVVGFLWRLASDVSAFARSDPGRAYLI